MGKHYETKKRGKISGDEKEKTELDIHKKGILEFIF